MPIKFRKWKYAKPSKIFIKTKFFNFLLKRNWCTIYDTRNKIDFKKVHIQKSINISSIVIKKTILKHKKNERIVLVGLFLRSNASVASWARYQGYKNVLLISKLIQDLPNKMLIKNN